MLISTRCDWNAKSDVSWITITSGTSGGGTDRVQYAVAANPDPGSRMGTLTITGGQILTVTQAGTPPGVPTLPPNSVVNAASFRPATDPNGAIVPRKSPPPAACWPLEFGYCQVKQFGGILAARRHR